MKKDCTEIFYKYRELIRLIWNLGFWSETKVRDSDLFTAAEYTTLFQNAVSRLFEGIVLLPLGYNNRVVDINTPGTAVQFTVEVKSVQVDYLIDRNLPNAPGHLWEVSKVPLSSGAYQFTFIEFFDWIQLGQRDFRYLKVLINHMVDRPDSVGHHALLEMSDCNIWLESKAPN
jgi:hypothetical protein